MKIDTYSYNKSLYVKTEKFHAKMQHNKEAQNNKLNPKIKLSQQYLLQNFIQLTENSNEKLNQSIRNRDINARHKPLNKINLFLLSISMISATSIIYANANPQSEYNYNLQTIKNTPALHSFSPIDRLPQKPYSSNKPPIFQKTTLSAFPKKKLSLPPTQKHSRVKKETNSQIKTKNSTCQKYPAPALEDFIHSPPLNEYQCKVFCQAKNGKLYNIVNASMPSMPELSKGYAEDLYDFNSYVPGGGYITEFRKRISLYNRKNKNYLNFNRCNVAFTLADVKNKPAYHLVNIDCAMEKTTNTYYDFHLTNIYNVEELRLVRRIPQIGVILTSLIQTRRVTPTIFFDKKNHIVSGSRNAQVGDWACYSSNRSKKICGYILSSQHPCFEKSPGKSIAMVTCSTFAIPEPGDKQDFGLAVVTPHSSNSGSLKILGMIVDFSELNNKTLLNLQTRYPFCDQHRKRYLSTFIDVASIKAYTTLNVYNIKSEYELEWEDKFEPALQGELNKNITLINKAICDANALQSQGSAKQWQGLNTKAENECQNL